VHPALLADADVASLAQDLSARGVTRHVIQAFRSQGCADAALVRDTRRERPLADLVEDVARLFQAGH
jgi:pyruvate formate lyase activating enzyme